MNNYICINGKKAELTEEQLQRLGLTGCGRTIAEICEIVKSGKAREHFSIHDTLTLGGYEMEVIGFDHDTTLGQRHVAREDHTMTLMAKTLLPARRMHSGACERGWIDTELRKWLNEEFVKQLPDELVQHIAPVFKLTHSANGEVYETRDKLFIPSESELFGSAIWSDYEDGPRYEAFATSELRVRVDEDGDGDWYWSRSAYGGTSTYCAFVYHYGAASYTSVFSISIRAPLCFCLA